MAITFNHNDQVYVNDGKLGIGTSTPEWKLQIHENSGGANYIKITNDNTSENGGNGVLIGISSSEHATFWNYENTNMRFATNGTERVTITNIGNVGIGTSNPGRKLHVVSNGAIAEFKSTDTGTSGFAEVHYENDAGDQLIVGSIGSGYTNTTWAGARYMYATAGDLMIKTLGSGTNLRFYTAGGTNERMRIDGNGNVGIGTTSPGGRLHIATPDPATNFVAIDFRNPTYGIYGKSNSISGRGNTLEFTSTDYNSGSVTTREVLTIRPEGNVGIGTTSPDSNLHVYTSTGQANIKVQSGTHDALFFANADTNFGIWGYDNTRFSLATNSTERLSITGDGNVGIGTTSPSYKLDVNGASRIYGNAQALTIQGSDHVYLGWSPAGSRKAYAGFASANSTSFTLMNEDSGHLYLGTNGNIKMTILSSGNVGIGTTVPNSLTSGVSSLSLGGTSTSTSGGLFYQVNGTYKAYSFVSNNAYIHRGQDDVYQSFWTDATEKMRITTDGNVGIGTTSPSRKLEVYSLVNTESSIRIRQASYNFWDLKSPASDTGFAISDVGGEKLRITSGGNVGIGTANPSTILTISKPIDSADYGAGTQALDFKIYYPGYDIDTVKASIYVGVSDKGTLNTQGGYLGFMTSNDGTIAERLRIEKNGNVGIGTTSPAEKLHVVGAIQTSRTTGATENTFIYNQATAKWGSSTYPAIIESVGNNSFLIGSSQNIPLHLTRSGAIALTIGTGNNVGIGTTSPSRILHIRKDVHNGIGSVIRLENNTGGGDNKVGILFTDGAYNSWIKGGRYDSETKSFLSFETTDSEAVRIDGDGNVGIGTTSPEAMLHVKAPAGSVGAIKIEGGKSGVTAIGEVNSRLDFGSNDGSVNSSGNIGGRIASVTEHPNGSQTGLAFSTFQQSRTPEDLAEAMRIASYGYVGIGTTSPAAKLHVVGDSYIESSGGAQTLLLERTGGKPTIKAGTTEGGNLILDSSTGNIYLNNYVNKNILIATGGGSVGIGTTNPSQRLHVSGRIKVDGGSADWILPNPGRTALGAIHLDPNTTADNYGSAITWGSSDNNLGEYADAGIYVRTDGAYGSKMYFATTDSYAVGSKMRMTIDETGNVGIGTTDPISELHVVGSARVVTNDSAGGDTLIGAINGVSNGYRILTNTSNEITYSWNTGDNVQAVTINNNGNVGIGTTSPSQKLHVSGTTISTNGFSSDGTSRMYAWRAVNNTGNNGDRYVKIARISSAQSARFAIELVGRRTSYSDGSNPAYGKIVGQLNNDNNYDIVFYDFENEVISVVEEVGQVDVNTTETDIYIKVGGYAEISATAHISMGSITVASTVYADEPVGYTLVNARYYMLHTAKADDRYVNVTGDTMSGGLNIEVSTSNTQLKLKRTTSATGEFNIYTNADSLYFQNVGQSTYPMMINSSGNVGIGTTSPGTGARLKVAGSGIDIESSTDSLRLRFYEGTTFRSGLQHILNTGEMITNSAVGDLAVRANAGNMLFATGGSSERMRITSGGNVGIGTDNPQYKLTVSSGTDDIGILTASSDSGSYVGFLDNATSVIPKIGAVGNKLILDASQYVGVRRTDPSYALDVSGTIRATGDVIAYSDARVKENVETIPNALDKVKAMRGVGYNKIGEEKRSIGVIAQEMLEVMPEVVSQDEQGMYSVAYGNLVGVLIEAVKDLESKVEQLQNKIDGIAS